MSKVRVAINGAGGRMGARLIALGAADPQITVAAGIDSPSNPRLGQDLGTLAGIAPLGVSLADRLPADVDAVIDFSTPEGTLAVLDTCLERRLPLVLATTGFEPADRERIVRAAERIALLWAPNMSLAVNLLMKLSAVAAEALKDQAENVDVEILERHHHFKEDSPSGTALRFGEIISGIMGQERAVHGRQGRPGRRPSGEIGYHAIRISDNPGEHTILFGLPGETIELTVRATNRDGYAQGALAAAKFLAGKPPGNYSIADVLGL